MQVHSHLHTPFNSETQNFQLTASEVLNASTIRAMNKLCVKSCPRLHVTIIVLRMKWCSLVEKALLLLLVSVSDLLLLPSCEGKKYILEEKIKSLRLVYERQFVLRLVYEQQSVLKSSPSSYLSQEVHFSDGMCHSAFILL
jgi:hypothetical protein